MRGRTTDSGGPSAQIHSPCFCFWGQREQAASPPACRYCRSPPSAWISLARTWTSRTSLTTLCGRSITIRCSVGHSTSWWLDQGPAARPRDPEVHCENARSAPVPRRVHTHDSLFCSHEPVRVPRPCLTRRPLSNWHVPEPGAPTPGCRQLVPIARALVRPCIWKVDLSAMEAQFDDPSSTQSLGALTMCMEC